MFFSFVGLFVRMRYMALMGLFCSFVSALNRKTSQQAGHQGSQSFAISIMSLTMMYMSLAGQKAIDYEQANKQ